MKKYRVLPAHCLEPEKECFQSSRGRQLAREIERLKRAHSAGYRGCATHASLKALQFEIRRLRNELLECA